MLYIRINKKNHVFEGFSDKLDETYKNIEITEEKHKNYIESQNRGFSLYWNTKENQLEAIKLKEFEYINDSGKIINDIEKLKENMKYHISEIKEKTIESGFEYTVNKKTVIQKCREKDKSNILGTIAVLKETGQKNIDWKFNDAADQDVIEKITLENLNEMLILGAQLTSKGIEVEQKLFYIISNLPEDELINFDVEIEFKKLMEE